MSTAQLKAIPGEQVQVLEPAASGGQGYSFELFGNMTGPLVMKRHLIKGLPAQLRASLIAGPDLSIDLDKLRETEGQSLLANLIALRGRLFASLDVAEECGDGNMLARVAGQLHRNLEITGELVGSLSSGATTINNILVQPQYVEMRISLVDALRPFPEAAHAVARVLHSIEHKAADAIQADTRELAR